MKFIKEWKTILEYRIPMHSWKIPTRVVILKYLNKPMSSREFSTKHGIKMALVTQTMYNLYDEGLLRRNPCDCGKGFIYQIKKQ